MWFTFIPVYFIYHPLTPKFISNVLITGFFLSAFLLQHTNFIQVCKNDTFHILPKTDFGVIKWNNHPCVFVNDTCHGIRKSSVILYTGLYRISPRVVQPAYACSPFKYAQLGLRQKSRQKVNFDVVIRANYVILWHLENLSSTCSCFYVISVIFDFLI